MKIYIQDCVTEYRAFITAVSQREVELTNRQWTDVFRSLYANSVDSADVQIDLDLGRRVVVSI